MTLFAISYVAGVLTIGSPCIVPVLPFVFSRVDEPFTRCVLPMLIGMVVTFPTAASLVAVGGGWAVQVAEVGRDAAIALVAVFGVTLVSQRAAAIFTRPVVTLGNRLSSRRETGRSSLCGSLLLGVAIGLLWAPCAGPILGLVLAAAALQGAGVRTALLLTAYAAGAATSLALATQAGGRIFVAMKRSLGIGERIRQGIGVAVLASALAIAFGLDTGLLTQFSFPVPAASKTPCWNGWAAIPASAFGKVSRKSRRNPDGVLCARRGADG
jgi:cytochrome c biogenesis protein CcdA